MDKFKYIIEYNELMKEWDWKENNKLRLNPNLLTKGTHTYASWICSKCGNKWVTQICNRVNGNGCPKCALNKRIHKNRYNQLKIKKSFKEKHPKLIEEWNYNKNIGLNPDNYVEGSGKKVWWKCQKCKYEWQTTIYNRCKRNSKCPKCSKNIIKQECIKKYIETMINKNGSLAEKYPDLLKEWNYEKNTEINPNKITAGTHLKVWWKCKKGHEWFASVANRSTKRSGCPYCSNMKILVGYNDLLTTNPELAKEWNYEKNINLTPIEIKKGYNRKVWWKCQKCGHEWQQTVRRRTELKSINTCPRCYKLGNQTSFPEQAIYYYISKVYKNVYNRYKLMNKYELDIYIKDANIAIEYDGLYFHNRDRTIKTEKVKNAITIEKKIILYRIKETKRKLNKPYIRNNIIYYNYDRGNNLNNAIMLLFKELRKEKNIDIDIERDFGNIINMYINVSTESSITNKGHGLLEEWNYEKNGNLKPDIINIHSNQKVWWKCPKGHEWRETPHSRIDKEGFSKCPYCSGRIAIKGVNDLKTVNPKFLQEWNYKKNGTLSPSDFMKYSNIKVWWKCKKGHEWQQKISNRNYNGCPYCANLKVLIGYNDLITTNPQISK